MTSGSGDQKIDRMSYSLQTILRLRDSLIYVLDLALGGKVLTGANFDKFIDLLDENLPPSADRACVLESVRHLTGETLTDEAILEVSHRLAGNVKRMRHRFTAPPWTIQRCQEWVPLQILGVKRGRNFRDKLGYLLIFKVMAGTPCPFLIRRWWSQRFCYYMAGQFGFARFGSNRRRDSKFMYYHPAQFVTLRLDGLIDPEWCKPREPMFHRVDVGKNLKAWNHEQLCYRFRISAEYPCPKNFTHACHQCPIGYLACRAGTHRLDYKLQRCQICGDDEAWFDLDVNTDICIDCHERRIIEKDKR
jgi:hypothetical protein